VARRFRQRHSSPQLSDYAWAHGAHGFIRQCHCSTLQALHRQTPTLIESDRRIAEIEPYLSV
jgi:hypothetical protein